jgi:hypothetical protein
MVLCPAGRRDTKTGEHEWTGHGVQQLVRYMLADTH